MDRCQECADGPANNRGIGSTDDLAVWFIDTDYNGRTSFLRSAYFVGGDDPNAKLKRALRAEIN